MSFLVKLRIYLKLVSIGLIKKVCEFRFHFFKQKHCWFCFVVLFIEDINAQSHLISLYVMQIKNLMLI